MDSKLMTTIIFTIIGSGIIAPLSKSIFDKIFAAYNPDPKKINSGIKKILVFSLQYLLPIGNMIYVFKTYKQVDKYFVFIVAFSCSAFIAILFFNIYNYFNSKIYKKYHELVLNSIDALKKQGVMTDDAVNKLLSTVKMTHEKSKKEDKNNS